MPPATGPVEGFDPAGGIALLDDLKVACVFLTRLPVRLTHEVSLRDLADAVYAFPVVGVLVGAAGGIAYVLLGQIGLAGLPAAVLALMVMVAITGALHEDGLADTADAIGVGSNRQRALEVMRDSRIGSYGAVALALALLARASAYGLFWEPGFFLRAAVCAAAVSRAAIPVVMLLQPSAKSSGLAASAGRPEPGRVYAAVGIAVALALLLLSGAAFKALAAAALAAAAAAWWLGRRFGGCTGDTLGAVQQAAEIGFLMALATELSPG